MPHTCNNILSQGHSNLLELCRFRVVTLRQSEIFALTFAQKLLLVANYVRVVLKRTVVGNSD